MLNFFLPIATCLLFCRVLLQEGKMWNVRKRLSEQTNQVFLLINAANKSDWSSFWRSCYTTPVCNSVLQEVTLYMLQLFFLHQMTWHIFENLYTVTGLTVNRLCESEKHLQQEVQGGTGHWLKILNLYIAPLWTHHPEHQKQQIIILSNVEKRWYHNDFTFFTSNFKDTFLVIM